MKNLRRFHSKREREFTPFLIELQELFQKKVKNEIKSKINLAFWEKIR